jgi:hypothetical protein
MAELPASLDKRGEIEQQNDKPWNLFDMLDFADPRADVNENEPNDTCPGEPYTLGDVMHGAINPPGDHDWYCFAGNAGDVLTIGTDADPGLPLVDTVIELYASDCVTQLAIDDDSGPGLYSLIDDYKLEYTGNYYLRVRGFSSSSNGNYIMIGVTTPQTGPAICPVGQYKASKVDVNMVISDTLGTICTPAIKFNPQNTVITDVVIDIEIEHTWVGDLDIVLRHTADNGEVREAALIARPGVPETTFGCAGDLIADPENKYYFGTRDDLEPLGEFDCPSVIDPACYAVAVENPGALEQFRGLFCGDGTWELCITDSAAGDDGFIHNWSVHILCEAPVAVESETWGNLKALYR